jgi:hypothetical protein
MKKPTNGWTVMCAARGKFSAVTPNETPVPNAMEQRPTARRTFLLKSAVLASGAALASAPKVLANPAESPATTPGPAPGAGAPGALFDGLADNALQAMMKRAEELRVTGVALVAYAAGERVRSWSSKMTVVGLLANAPSDGKPGNNLLGIAYAKAAEMAETLKDSGSKSRPPMVGEFGWQGGLIRKGKTGHLIAAFSGGPSEKDVEISRAGLDILAGAAL